jgi:hypothetical protein
MQHLSGVWADVLAWAAILAALAACAGLFVRRDRPHRAPPPLTVIVADPDLATEAPRRLGRAQEWRLIIRSASQGLEGGAALAALQSEAALKLAAAEHAFNRLVADYGNLRPHSATSPIAPPHRPTPGSRTPAHTLERPTERRPLAA